MPNKIRPFIVSSHGGTPIAAQSTTSVFLADTDRGFLPNRLTSTERDAISDPPEGLVIYNTTTNRLEVFTTAWGAVGGGGSSSPFTVNSPVTPAGSTIDDAVQLSTGITPFLAADTGTGFVLPAATAGSVLMLMPVGNGDSYDGKYYIVYNAPGDTIDGIDDVIVISLPYHVSDPYLVIWIVCDVDGSWWSNGLLD